MIKKNPRYRVTVYTQKETLTIEYPITCKFTVTRSTFSKSTECNILLYNLAESTRNVIFQDLYSNAIDPTTWKYVHLEAGYGDTLTAIFKGRIKQAYSYKSGGQTDIITEIQVIPFDIFDYQTSVTFEAGTSFKDAYKTMASDMPNCQIGNIGSLEGSFKTQTTFDGASFDEINKLTGGHTFVDNGVLNTIMSNEVIDVPVPVIGDDSALLQTPMKRGAQLEVRMLFEPSLIIGQLLEIDSRISPQFNGQFKVIGFTHDCLISGSQAGHRTTTATLWITPFLPGADINLTNEQVTTGNAAPINKVKGETLIPITPISPTTKWIMPTKGRLSSPYGWRIHPISKTKSWHKGIDIANNAGTQIKAIADGTAYYVGYENKWNGNTIRINHGLVNGVNVESVYIHLQGFNIRQGAKVTQGQVIGFMGSTGSSTGPHLHLSIYEGKRGNDVNPFKYVDRSKY